MSLFFASLLQELWFVYFHWHAIRFSLLEVYQVYLTCNRPVTLFLVSWCLVRHLLSLYFKTFLFVVCSASFGTKVCYCKGSILRSLSSSVHVAVMLRLSIWWGHATAFSQMLSDLSLFTSLLSFWLQIYLKSVLNCLLISAKEIEKQVPSKTISLYTQLQKRWHLRSVCYGRLITFKPSPIASWFSAFSRASSNLLVFTLYSYWLLLMSFNSDWLLWSVWFMFYDIQSKCA